MKAEKKAADKDAKVKESGDMGAPDGDEETLDPNVRFFFLNGFLPQTSAW